MYPCLVPITAHFDREQKVQFKGGQGLDIKRPLVPLFRCFFGAFRVRFWQGLAGHCRIGLGVQRTPGEATGGEGAQDAGATPSPEGSTMIVLRMFIASAVMRMFFLLPSFFLPSFSLIFCVACLFFPSVFCLSCVCLYMLYLFFMYVVCIAVVVVFVLVALLLGTFLGFLGCHLAL